MLLLMRIRFFLVMAAFSALTAMVVMIFGRFNLLVHEVDGLMHLLDRLSLVIFLTHFFNGSLYLFARGGLKLVLVLL